MKKMNQTKEYTVRKRKRKKNYLFVHNRKLRKLIEQLISISQNLQFFRKHFISLNKQKKNEKEKEKEKNDFNDTFSFFTIYKKYEKFMKTLLNWCYEKTDLYVEFLFVLMINSELYNHFLYISTFTSGDKNDALLFLLHQHFLFMNEYCFYFNNRNYLNDMFDKLNNIYQQEEKKQTGKQKETGKTDKDSWNDQGNENKERKQKEVLHPCSSSSKSNLGGNSRSNSSNEKQQTESRYQQQCTEHIREDCITITKDMILKEGTNKVLSGKPLCFSEEHTKHISNPIKNEQTEQPHKKNSNYELITSSIKSPIGETSPTSAVVTNKVKQHEESFYVKKKEGRNVKDKAKAKAKAPLEENKDKIRKEKKIKNNKSPFLMTNIYNLHSSPVISNFNFEHFYALQRIFPLFQKLTCEHIYILLYFSLSILPHIFHIYLTRLINANNKTVDACHYLMLVSKKIKKETMTTISLKKIQKKHKRSNEEKNTYSEKAETHTSTDNIPKSENHQLLKKKKKKKDDEQMYSVIKQCLYSNEEKNKWVEEALDHFNIKSKLEKLNDIQGEDKNYTEYFKQELILLHSLQTKKNIARYNLDILKKENEQQFLKSEIMKLPEDDTELNPKRKYAEDATLEKSKNENENEKNMEAEKQTPKEIKKEEDKNKDKDKSKDKDKHKDKHMNKEYKKKDTSWIHVLEKKLQIWNLYTYFKKLKKNQIKNYEGFDHFFKNVTTLCTDSFISFFMKNIDIKSSVEKNENLLNVWPEKRHFPFSETEENDITANITTNTTNTNVNDVDCLHINNIHKSTSLMCNEYIKRKIKRNKLYTYKLFNNQIETLLSSKELTEYMKKQKELKKKSINEQTEKKNQQFLYTVDLTNASEYFKKKKKKEPLEKDKEDLFECINEQNKGTNLTENFNDKCYKSVDSSDSITLYNFTKNFYIENNFIMDHNVFFIVNVFYLFLHLHNIYFSFTYLNIFLSFSLKLVYKYTHNFQSWKNANPNKKKQKKTDTEDYPIDSSPKKKGESEYTNGIYTETQAKGLTRDVSSHSQQKFLYFKNFKNQKSTKELMEKTNSFHMFASSPKKKDFPKNVFLFNTFDIIVNSFFDLCISLCNMKFIGIKGIKHKWNYLFLSKHIFYYYHIINRRYNANNMYAANKFNYENALESYLFYFDELKKSEQFKNQFIDTKFSNDDQKKKGLNSSKIYSNENTCKDDTSNKKDEEYTSTDDGDDDDNKSLFEEEHWKDNLLVSNCRKKEEAKEKGKKTTNMLSKFADQHFATLEENSNETSSDEANSTSINSTSNLSDKSFLFLKKLKKKKKYIFYTDENNIIHILINIGCLFMNNMKYNIYSNLKQFYKINEWKDNSLNNERDFYSYLMQTFFSKKKKHASFLNIHNRYFISFFFFLKIHYIFFLIKYKCETEIYLKAYWFLYAVYNITQN